MTWDFPDNAPRAAAYPSPDPNVIGNALAGLVGDYQRAAAGSQALQQGKIRLDVQRALKGGVPIDPATGLPDPQKVAQSLAQAGDPYAIGAAMPDIVGQFNRRGVSAPDPLAGGAKGGGGSVSLPASSGDLVSGLEAHGYSPNAAAGIVGNFAQESGLDTGSIGDSGTSIGLANWHNERAAALKAFAASQGKDWRDKDVQIDFANREIRSNPALYQALQNATTPKEAADLISSEFERPNPTFANLPRREALAEQAAKLSGGGTAIVRTPYSRQALDSGAYDYHTPDTPVAPPVSAAGSNLGRTSPMTGRDPRSPSTGPYAYTPGGDADAAQVAGGYLAPGVLGSLTGVSPAEAGTLPRPQQAPAGGAPISGQPAATPSPQAVASLPAAAPPSQRTNPPIQQTPTGRLSVAQIVADAVQDPRKASLIAHGVANTLGVDPSSPLTPDQAEKVRLVVGILSGQKAPSAPSPVQARVAGAGAPTQPPGQLAPPQGQMQPPRQQSLVPQVPLPGGMTDPMQAVAKIDQDIQRLAMFTGGQSGEIAKERIRNLELQKAQILAQSMPYEARPGVSLLDPRNAQPIFRSPLNNPMSEAFQAFMERNPNATPEQMQAFIQSGRSGRSGIAMYMNQWKLEHPDATSEDFARAAQGYAAQVTGLTRFTTGVQGNAIRSFNVLVDHLDVLGEATKALKNGDIKRFNAVGQFIAEEMGVPAPTNFDAVKRLVSGEIIKATTGSAGALGDRDEIATTFNKTNSEDALLGVMEEYRQLSIGQLGGLKKQFDTVQGLNNTDSPISFDDMLLPRTRKYFSRDGEAAPAGSGATQGGGASGVTSTGVPWSVK